jgi:hypothetical protein
MLIYAKKSTAESHINDTPKVPARVMNVIKELNSAHDTTLSEYKAKYVPPFEPHVDYQIDSLNRSEKIKAEVLALRKRVRGIYASWSTNLREVNALFLYKKSNF